MNKLDLNKPIKTRDGRSVRILCTDLKDDDFSIVAAVKLKSDEEIINLYTENGGYHGDEEENRNDLMNVSDIMDTPQHKHNCDECTFLGREGEYDLYFHSQPHETTIIARRSSEPSDYISGLCFADQIPVLGVARDRAKERGLL